MSLEAALVVDATIQLGELALSTAFSLSRGGLIAISGDVGSGKSSLLRLVAGELRATAGVVQYGSQLWDCTDTGVFVPPEDRPVALLPQNFRSVFSGDASPFETIAKFKGADSANTLLHTLALGEHVIHRPAHTLSNGEAQRAALALALAKGPEVLLLDEPFVALDRYTSDTVHACLDGWLAETGTPTIIVTQDEADHDHFVDRVIHLPTHSLTP